MAEFRRWSVRLVLWLAICSVGRASAEEKYVQFGVGTSFKGDSTAYAFDFEFNRTEAEESKTGPWLHVWDVHRWGAMGLRPSATASLGNGSGSAPNNLTADLQLRVERPVQRTSRLILALSPTGAADKNFDTGIGYARASIGFLRYWSGHTRCYVLPAVNADWGIRKSRGRSSDPFTRLGSSLEVHGVIRERLSGSVIAKLAVIDGDRTVIPDGSYGNCTATADYRFLAPKKGPTAGFAIKYVVGHDEPLFKKLNALTCGIALYR